MSKKEELRRLCKEINVPEYIVLHNISTAGEISEINPGRTYLQELADKMQLSIRQTAKMVGELKDRGLLLWSHDGNGSEGTYVTITEMGQSILEEQENILRNYYGRVVKKYGKENFVLLLQLMKQLENVMHSEIERTQIQDGYDKLCE